MPTRVSFAVFKIPRLFRQTLRRFANIKLPSHNIRDQTGSILPKQVNLPSKPIPSPINPSRLHVKKPNNRFLLFKWGLQRG